MQQDAGTAVPRQAARFSLPALAVLLIMAVLLRAPLQQLLDRPVTSTLATVFVAIVVQAMPFLALGVLVSAAIAALLPDRLLAAALPDSTLLAVPVAAAAGAVLPGCECGSIPIANRLLARGVPAPAALAFLLSAPAINPVVLVATAVAFPGRPGVVVARALAGLLCATLVGWCWHRLDLDHRLLPRPRQRRVGQPRAEVFLGTAVHDFLSAGGFLVIGAFAAASLQTLVPRAAIDRFAQPDLIALLALGALAVLLSICSEADAFIAASMRQFPVSAQLAFMVVGPMVDLKLISMQAGTFGRRFAARFAPLTFAVALLVSAGVSWIAAAGLFGAWAS